MGDVDDRPPRDEVRDEDYDRRRDVSIPIPATKIVKAA